MYLLKKLKDSFAFKNQMVNFLLTLFFVVCIFPYSFNVGGQGVSGNYLFVFFPILYLIFSGQIYWPKLTILLFLFLLICIFLASFIFQPEYFEYSIRRIASFILFMSIFAFMFVQINFDMIRSLKFAIVIFSLYTAVSVLIRYIDHGMADLGSYAKGEVGSTRIGFIYIMALWIVFFYDSKTFLFYLLKHIAAIFLIIGLLLTFNRASTFSLFFTIIAYLVVITLSSFKDGDSLTELIKKIFISVAYIIILTLLLGKLFPNTVTVYKKYYSYLIPNEIPALFTQAETSLTTQAETSLTTQAETSLTTQAETSLTTQADSNLKDEFESVINNSENIIEKIIGTLKVANLATEVDLISLGMNDCLSSCTFYERLINKNTSEGYRVYVANKVINFVSESPFIGSGFLGVWIMFDEVKGSAHSQYLDVLFRLGIIGFLFYLFFIYRILKFLYFNDKGLFIGFLGMLFYGFFHETFKLSHGAFIFAFLFAMYDQRELYYKK